MEAEGFVEQFAAAWDRPDPEDFLALLRPEIRLIAPLTPTTVGRDQARQVFGRLLRLIPDLRGDVHDWAAHPDGVFIFFTLSGSLGGRPVGWRAVDRFLLRDGLAAERVSYFDSLPLLADAIRLPAIWPRLLRSGVRPGRGSRHPEREPQWSPVSGTPAGEQFALAHAARWQQPSADGLASLLHSDARLELPGFVSVNGREPARSAFEKMLALAPDLRGTPLRFGQRGDTIFLEGERSATIGRRLVRWRLAERFELRGEQAVAGIAFHDTAKHAAALALAPRAAARWRRSRLLQGRRASDAQSAA